MTASGQAFDVVVIGAGPAGSLSALLAARAELSVLLVEKKPFPRDKVCGCCLSQHAFSALQTAGLSHVLEDSKAPTLRRLLVSSGNRELSLKIPPGRSISRASLDNSLLSAATAAGATFLPDTRATIIASSNDTVDVQLEPGDVVRGSIVVAADGLGGTSLSSFTELHPRVSPNSRVGTSTISSAADEFYSDGTIYMGYNGGGYLGLVRLEDGRLDIAAAFDVDILRKAGSARAAAGQLLRSCGWPVPAGFDELTWSGTVALTRRRPRVAAKRIFVVGDSASYVEPFTGEGIGWALNSALLSAPMVAGAAKRWDDDFAWRWEHTYRRTIMKQQQATRMVSTLLKHPTMANSTAELLLAVPALQPAVVGLVCGKPAETNTWR